MKIIFKAFVAAALLSALFSCRGKETPKPDPVPDPVSMDGIIINEIMPSRAIGKEGWIELYNTTDKSIPLQGMVLLLTSDSAAEEPVCTLKTGTIEPKGRFLIKTAEVQFSTLMLRATFQELSILDSQGFTLDSFSVRIDCGPNAKLDGDEDSFARIPDASKTWKVTETSTPGEKNYKVTPYTISGLVINEVCPAEGWVEIYNSGKKEMKLEYSYIKAKDGTRICFLPEETVLPVGERLAIDCSASAVQMAEFTYYTNDHKQVTTFSSSKLPAITDGSSWSRLPDATGDFQLTSVPTKGQPNKAVTTDESGLKLNEFSLAGWGEISNSSLFEVKTPGITVTIDGKTVFESGSTTIPSGGHLSFSANITASSKVVLKGSDGKELDSFTASLVHGSREASQTTSWSRIPDSNGPWYTVINSSRDEKNWGITEDNKVAIWVNHSSMDSYEFEKMAKLGVGNIVIHEFIFRSDYHKKADVEAFIDKAHSLGMKVHIWQQCFWWSGDVHWPDGTVTEGDWVSAIIDGTPAKVNQPRFDEIIKRSLNYVNYDIDGIHYDYVRFGGSAYKHGDENLSGTMAITEFCRQAETKIHAKNPGIIMSAALMGESGAQKYYGQDPEQMTRYIDILMPMAYISSYNYSSTKNVSVANWFADGAHKNGKECWHGFSTYDANSQGLSADRLDADIVNIVDNSRADGVALFRYGIGQYPDMNGYYRAE